MSKFNEVWSMLHDENMKATEGKKHRNVPYSKKKEAQLAQALLNTPDYEMPVMKTKNGEFFEEKQQPVAEFRKQFVEKVLKDNGVDKQQAEAASKEYNFSLAQAQALNNLNRESVEQFMRAGFSYDFGHKKDFAAQIKLRDIPDRVVTGKIPGTGEVVKTHELPHKALVKKSGTPKYCKQKA